MTDICPYCVLGVGRDSNAEQIRKAYLNGCFQYHPDRHQGSRTAESKFKEIADAYNIIKSGKTVFLCKKHVHSNENTQGRCTYKVYANRDEDEDVVARRVQEAWDAAMAVYDKEIQDRRDKVNDIAKQIWNYRNILLNHEITFLIGMAELASTRTIVWRQFQVRQMESLLETVQRRALKKSSLVEGAADA